VLKYLKCFKSLKKLYYESVVISMYLIKGGSGIMNNIRFREINYKRTSILTFIVIFLFMSFSIYANPKVISVSMVPTAPTFGDAVNITVTYCSQNYNLAMIDIAMSSQSSKTSAELSGNGQVFVVSRAGIDVATSQPAATTGGEIGWIANANPNGPATGNCTSCDGNAQSTIRTVTYTVHVPPAAYFPGCNVTKLYLFVGMKDSNLNAPEWVGSSICGLDPAALSWNIGSIAKNFSISKRTEGVVQVQNDLVLFSIDYEYWNGNLTITDTVPGGGDLALVSFGPSAIAGVPATGPAIGAISGNFTWTLPDRTGQPGTASGTVWMLYKELKNPPTAGTKYTNNATGTMSGIAPKTASATNTVGQAAISIIKDQSEANPKYGDNITYILTYNVNGMQLVAYQPFDEFTQATPYAFGSFGIGGTAVPGWSFVDQNGTEGKWTLTDACNTGDKIITGSVNATKQYPGLLYNGLPASDHLCSGIIETDVLINPNGYEGSDAMIFIRNDGLVGGNAYGVAISVDKNIGGYTAGHIEFQACTSGPGCYWPTGVAIGTDPTITANKWWRVKIWIDPTNQYHFKAKAWAKGDPEPTGYQIEWTDLDAARQTALNCNNGSNWRAGYGEQGGDDGANWAQDSYNNFVVYNPRTSASTTVWDTVPNAVAGASDGSVIYTSLNPPPVPKTGSYAGGVVTFNLGSLSDEGGSLTWWGKVNSCNPITNESFIGGAGEVSQKSNQVIANPVCPTPVITLIKSHVAVASVVSGDKITWTLNVCNSAAGPTANPMTVWDTVPTTMNFGGYIGTAGTPPLPGSGAVMWWDASPLAAGACTNFTWWGTVK
jgi:hypothetical protein